MEDLKNRNTITPEKKSVFEYFTEITGWIQIAISPFFIGIIIGAVIYFLKPNKLTLIIAFIIAIIGLCIGIVWATKVWRKKGTIHFISRTMATPDLDPPTEETK